MTNNPTIEDCVRVIQKTTEVLGSSVRVNGELVELLTQATGLLEAAHADPSETAALRVNLGDMRERAAALRHDHQAMTAACGRMLGVP